MPSSLTATFNPGQLSVQVPIDIVPDQDPEGDETFIVQLGAPTGGIPVTKAIGICTILDARRHDRGGARLEPPGRPLHREVRRLRRARHRLERNGGHDRRRAAARGRQRAGDAHLRQRDRRALNTAAAANGSVSTYTPPHAAGVVDVAIRCCTEEFTLAKAYTYTPSTPRITRIAPATGSINGGTIVTANGENLPRGRCGLWFDNSPATTLTNQLTSEMSAIAPPHGAASVAVTLRCGGDLSTLSDAFLYTSDEPRAEIAAINPAVRRAGRAGADRRLRLPRRRCHRLRRRRRDRHDHLANHVGQRFQIGTTSKSTAKCTCAMTCRYRLLR